MASEVKAVYRLLTRAPNDDKKVKLKREIDGLVRGIGVSGPYRSRLQIR